MSDRKKLKSGGHKHNRVDWIMGMVYEGFTNSWGISVIAATSKRRFFPFPDPIHFTSFHQGGVLYSFSATRAVCIKHMLSCSIKWGTWIPELSNIPLVYILWTLEDQQSVPTVVFVGKKCQKRLQQGLISPWRSTAPTLCPAQETITGNADGDGDINDPKDHQENWRAVGVRDSWDQINIKGSSKPKNF